MTNDSIVASFVWTVEEYLTLARSLRSHAASPLVRFFYGFVMGIVFIGGVALIQSGKGHLPSMGDGLCGIALLYFYWIAFGRQRALRRGFARAGAAIEPDQKITFILDGTGVRKMSPGTDWATHWELVTKGVECAEGFLLCVGSVIFWLPNHAFPDQESRQRFVELAASRLSNFVRKRSLPSPATSREASGLTADTGH